MFAWAEPVVPAVLCEQGLDLFSIRGAAIFSPMFGMVDELDRLKDTKDPHVRWRPGYTLGVLDRVWGR